MNIFCLSVFTIQIQSTKNNLNFVHELIVGQNIKTYLHIFQNADQVRCHWIFVQQLTVIDEEYATVRVHPLLPALRQGSEFVVRPCHSPCHVRSLPLIGHWRRSACSGKMQRSYCTVPSCIEIIVWKLNSTRKTVSQLTFKIFFQYVLVYLSTKKSVTTK